MSGRKPEYRIGALNKVTEERGRIGAGWVNPDGSISLVFDPFTTVPVGRDYVITMFPEKVDPPKHVPRLSTKYDPDDIPGEE